VTGATGLEPATSGVTGRAGAATILHGATPKNTDSSGFVEDTTTRHDLVPTGFPTLPLHPRPIVASPGTTTDAFGWCGIAHALRRDLRFG
jgi:hypothetical protein